ncbi:MAG TPA: hypothetical protein VFC61_08980 [Blastocatellia bacterium]|nr:hypothetical protein [Blastocatellia bacterium]
MLTALSQHRADLGRRLVAGADDALLGALVQAGDADGEPARDEREVTGEAEAALEEFDPPPGSASSRGL